MSCPSPRPHGQSSGLSALLALSAPPHTGPFAVSGTVRVPVVPVPEPIRMDDPAEPRRYRLVRLPYLVWERTRLHGAGEFSALADAPRRALSRGIGR